MPKNAKEYICEICNFECSKKSNLNAHFLTQKHIRLMKPNKKMPPEVTIQLYKCHCGNEYKHMSSLCKHKRNCNLINNDTKQKEVDSDTEPLINSFSEQASVVKESISLDVTVVLELMKQNQDFKEIITKQSEKLIELCTEPKMVNSNNTQNINNQFNLNFFLNEQCKGAQNLDEFIADIIVNMDDIKYLDQFGYSEGMTHIIVKEMNKRDIFNRPIHCTDLKRETIYVKNNDTWTKEGPNQENMHRIINTTYRKNQNEMRAFLRENPHLSDTKSPDWDYYMRLVRKSMGGICENEDARYAAKIIKGLAKMVVVDKETLGV